MSSLVRLDSNECHSVESALIEKITSVYGTFNSAAVASSGPLGCEVVHKHSSTTMSNGRSRGGNAMCIE